MDAIEIQPLHIYTHDTALKTAKRIGLAILGVGLLMLLVTLTGVAHEQPVLFLFLSVGLIVVGALLFILPQIKEAPAGIKNNGNFSSSVTSRGMVGWIFGVIITGFYVLLYWFPGTLENWVRLVDSLSMWLRGEEADRWFLYGFFYTSSILVMGVRMIVKYRHNRYQIIRTLSVTFFQLVFAFVIPGVLRLFNQPEFYFSYFWPLKYQYLYPDTVKSLTSSSGGLGYFMVFWSVAMTFVVTPTLTYFFGKRWYCSWVCGCGGLAETTGDPFRQLSDKSLTAWKIERWMIHSVLVFVVLTTASLWINSATEGALHGSVSSGFAQTYGFVIDSVFSGIVGVGFYPLMGSRVWCRFGCPMAATLGIMQKFKSRFRITTNG